MNIEQRKGVWYATVLVPKDVREVIGRVRFKKSLGTANKREAQLLAAPHVAAWWAQIRQARGSSNAVATEALRWRRALAEAPDEDTLEAFELALSDKTEAMAEAQGDEAAHAFHSVAAGTATPTSEYYEGWKEQITLAAKTKDQMIKDVALLVAKFPTLQGINKNSVRRWVDELTLGGKGASSLRRILSFCRNYWKYVAKYGAVERGATPFDGVIDPASKGKRKKANLPYSPRDVVKLWKAASLRRVGLAKDAPFDTQLANLVKLGAYTGARIEELCSVKVEKVSASVIKIEDAKTEAGWREVPIHAAIADLVKKLKKESKDGYLLSGLTFNKYGDRSNAIGKRFGRLKEELGFDEFHTFHSLRSTVATLLENAHIPEGVAADIIGHEKTTMTYGLYSGGASLATKREALAKVSYPFPK